MANAGTSTGMQPAAAPVVKEAGGYKLFLSSKRRPSKRERTSFYAHHRDAMTKAAVSYETHGGEGHLSRMGRQLSAQRRRMGQGGGRLASVEQQERVTRAVRAAASMHVVRDTAVEAVAYAKEGRSKAFMRTRMDWLQTRL